MARLVLVAAALVAVAGCSGFVGTRPTDTLTPAPVPATPTATPTPTPTPGQPSMANVSAVVVDGVEPNEAFTLAGAHHDEINPAGYTRVSRLTIRGPNRTLRNVSRRLLVAPGGTPYHLVVESESHPAYPVSPLAPRIDVYYQAPQALVRLQENGSVTYVRPSRPEPDGPVTDRTGDARIAGLLSTFDVTLRGETPTEGDGRGVVLTAARAEGPAGLQVPILLEAPRNISLRVVVTDDGVVRRYRLAYDATYDGTTVRVVRRTRFRRVGATTVEAPDWYRSGLNATSDDRVPGG